MQALNELGQIITFYSYKGGTGRSMALANVAWILASNGKRVLAVDWDLEAPGLHRYFAPFLVDKDLTATEGVIDFVSDFVVKALTPAAPGTTLAQDWHVEHANILRYSTALDARFPNGGRLDLIPAGKQGPNYSTRVNSFDWHAFYERLGGGAFLEAAREKMRREYDYVLIDSRTGVSDTSGISTVQLPDALVVCFTLNNQGIEGAAAVANSVFAQRTRAKLKIFPVPMRVDPFEKEKLDIRKAYAESKFADFPDHLKFREREEYRRQVQFPYKPYYAYEEVLAAFGDRSGETNTLLEAAERLASYLVGDSIRLVEPTEDQRRLALAQYASVPLASNRYDFTLHADPEEPEEAEWAHALLERLERETFQGRKFRIFFAPRDVRPGEDALEKTTAAMANSRKIGLVLSPRSQAGVTGMLNRIDGAMLEHWRSRGRILPLLRQESELPEVLGGLNPIRFREGEHFEDACRLLLAVLKDEPLPRTTRGTTYFEMPTRRPETVLENTARLQRKAVDLEDLVNRAKAMLGGRTAGLAEVKKLVKELKRARCFGWARKVLKLFSTHPELAKNPDLKLEMSQQWALCTYKDADLPTGPRLDEALEILEQHQDLATTKNQETLGLAGAIFKRKWEVDGQKQHLERSLAYYFRGYAEGIAGDTGYTAINAAFLLDLLAHLELAQSASGAAPDLGKHAEQAAYVRKKILATLLPMGEESPERKDWWFMVTVAEAYFGLQEYEAAARWLEYAAGLPNVDAWEYESTARQLATLARLQGYAGTSAEECENSPAWRVLSDFLGDNTAAVRTAFLGKVGLALSGGGFRASLFHIGVLARLAELDMLRHVEVLSCVSGGSVIGAHYYLEVRKLLEEKADAEITRADYVEMVERIARDFLAGVQRNVRTRVAASLKANAKMIFFPSEYSRTERLGELFESEIFARVQDGKSDQPRWLNDLFILPKGEDGNVFKPKYDNWRRRAKVPMLVLNATALNTGHNWQFTASWMGEPPSNLENDIDGNERLRRMYYSEAPPRHQRVRLGTAVAASACVPGLFEPIVLAGLYPGRTVRLVDGGVHDNQGVASLIEQDCLVQLVSDASGQMGAEKSPSNGILGVSLRAMSITMSRIRAAEYADLEARRKSSLLRGLMFVHLKKELDMPPVRWIDCDEPGEPGGATCPVTQYAIRRDLQERIAAIRTDLDSFSDPEAYALMSSGYRQTEAEFAQAIEGFPAAPEDRADWGFLKLDEILRQQEKTARVAALSRLLEIGREKAFKVWRISGPLQALAVFLGIVGLALIVWTFLQFADVSVLSVGKLGMFAFSLAVGAVLGKQVFKIVQWRETLWKIAAGIAMSIGGSLAAWVHLKVFDPLFLSLSRSIQDKIIAPPPAPAPANAAGGIAGMGTRAAAADSAALPLAARRSFRTLVAAAAVAALALIFALLLLLRSDWFLIKTIIRKAPVKEALVAREAGVDRVMAWAAALARSGRTAESRAVRDLAVSSTNLFENDLEHAKILISLGVGLEQLGEPEEAGRKFREAEGIGRNLRNDADQAWVLTTLLPHLRRASGGDALVRDAAAAVTNAVSTGRLDKASEKVWALTRAATNLSRAGRNDEARQVLLQAQTTARGVESEGYDKQVWAQNRISAVQAQVGDYQDALRTLEGAKQAATQVTNAADQQWARESVLISEAETMAQDRQFEDALRIAASVTDPRAQARAFLGVIPHSDEPHFLEKLQQQAAEKITAPEDRSRLFTVLAAQWRELKEDRRAASALDLARSAAEKISLEFDKSRAMADAAKGFAGLREFHKARGIADRCAFAADRLDAYTAILSAHAAQQPPSAGR